MCKQNASGTTCLKPKASLRGAEPVERVEWAEENKTRCLDFENIETMLSPPVFTSSEEMGDEVGSFLELESVHRLLMLYSGRILSDGSDALNAILGTLRSVKTEYKLVYHLLGIPIGMRGNTAHWSAAYGGELTIGAALHWFSYDVLIRRTEFPSWSPLGWRGPIYCSEEPVTLLSSEFSVRFWDGGEYRELDRNFADPDYALRTGHISKSQYLEITVHVGS